MQPSFARQQPAACDIGCFDLANTDGGLLKLIAAGDKIAMSRLFVRYHRRVHNFAHRLTGSRSISDEIVSEVFLAVWQSAQRFEGKSKVSTWLLAIARNKAIAALRMQQEAPLEDRDSLTIIDQADNPETVVHQLRRNAILRHYLHRLSPAHRQIVELIYYRGKSISDAARIAGIPEGTVKSRMATARCRMADFLKAAGLHQYQEC